MTEPKTGPSLQDYDRYIGFDPVSDAFDSRRAAVVAVAKAELGSHQRDSVQVREYIATVLPSWSQAQVWQASRDPRFHWCGVFALWCLHTANVTRVPWQIGRGFVWRLPKTREPLPGDVFVGPGPAWHHGIVESRYMVGDRIWLASIEGNTPDVRRKDRPEPPNYTYYSITPWLKQALGVLQ